MVYLIIEFSRVILQNPGCSLEVDFKRVRINRTVIVDCRVGTGGCLLAKTIFCSILSLLLSSSRGCSPWRSTSSANLTVLMGCVDCIQWIAASVTSLPSRNDKEGELEYFGVSLIRLQVKVDCHVGTVGAFSQ